ncbi:MAG: PEP-CTERM sorting domain-containing protein [Rubrivivax sp.]|nr:PEP-CTERM sorting domain-containing protein [Rubrivivax sp.]
MNRSLASALLAAAAALAAPAQAATGGPSLVSCASSFDTISNPGYISCQGIETGNIAAGQVNSASFAGFGSFSLVGTSNDGSGVFSANPASTTWGTLHLTSAQTGHFVIGIKGGPTYSLYLFDGGVSGIGALDFDTFGITDGGGLAGPNFSHAALFTPTLAVPEPGALALMLAGVAAVGSVVRRRRPA